MNTSGEAAEQVMRMMLGGTEVLIKLSGSGAKNAAILIYSICKQQNQTRGAQRLTNMLRSGKPIKVYTFKDKDLPKFKECAKQYGVLYTVLKDKNKTDGLFDVMVHVDDDSKLTRIIERFKLTKVDTATLRASIIKEQQERKSTGAEKEEPEKERPENIAAVVDDIFSGEEPIKKERQSMANPTVARTDGKDFPEASEPPSELLSEATKGLVKNDGRTDNEKGHLRESVRKKIEVIKSEKGKIEKAKENSLEITAKAVGEIKISKER